MNQSTEPVGVPADLRLNLARRPLIVGACLLPVGWVAFLVGKSSVNVPFSDEWELIPLLQKQAAGTLRFTDIWAQHNEHRSFFPELIMLRMARFTHWNIRAEVLLDVILAAITLAVLLFLLKRTVGPIGQGPYAVAAVLFAWMMFSPRQWENWLWGWQIAWYLSNLGAVAAAGLLSEWPDRWPSWLGVACAATAATVASFSLAVGLCAWASLLVIFALRKHVRQGLPVWILFAVATFALYLHNYRLTVGGFGYALKHPVAYVAYFLAYLGAPVAGRELVSIVAGTLICVTLFASSAYLARRHLDILRRSAAWVALALYGMLGAAITDLGRLNVGVSQSQNSRYTTLSMLVALSAVALGFIAARSYERAKQPAPALTMAVRAFVLVAATAVVFLSYNLSLWRLGYQHDLLTAGDVCLRTAQGPSDPCLMTLYPNPVIEWNRLAYLRANGIGGLPKP
jgi:hypothetical protein